MGDCARLCLGSPQSATPPAPLSERSQDRSHRVVSPGTRVTGMTSSGSGLGVNVRSAIVLGRRGWATVGGDL